MPCNPSPSLAAFLRLSQVLDQKNRPFYMLCKMSKLVRDVSASKRTANGTRGSIPDPMLSRIEQCISDLGGCIGGCERILSTPIPLSYSRHTSRSLMLWLTTLPFALWEPMGWAMLPALFLISYIFVGIDEIGVEIEEVKNAIACIQLTLCIIASVRFSIGFGDVTWQLLAFTRLSCASSGTHEVHVRDINNLGMVLKYKQCTCYTRSGLQSTVTPCLCDLATSVWAHVKFT